MELLSREATAFSRSFSFKFWRKNHVPSKRLTCRHAPNSCPGDHVSSPVFENSLQVPRGIYKAFLCTHPSFIANPKRESDVMKDADLAPGLQASWLPRPRDIPQSVMWEGVLLLCCGSSRKLRCRRRHEKWEQRDKEWGSASSVIASGSALRATVWQLVCDCGQGKQVKILKGGK